MKFFQGVCSLLGVLLLIAGPLLLFSTFNPIADLNPVLSSDLTFNIRISQQDSMANNTFQLFHNAHVLELRGITEKEYNDNKFGNSPYLYYTQGYKIDQVQLVKMSSNSDNEWIAS